MVWPEESLSTDTNKYIGIIYFCAVLVPWFFLLGLYFYRRDIQPIKGGLPVLSCLAQLCVLFHQTYLVGLMLWGDLISCSVSAFCIYMTILAAVDFYLARGYILYFIFHVTQERLAMASEKINHERQASQLDVTQHQKDGTSRETTLKWFLRNRYRVERPFLSACLVSALLLESIYPVIYTIQHPSRHPDFNSNGCGYTAFSPILGIEFGILIIMAIWIAGKLRNIKDGFFLKDELRFISACGAIGLIGWLALYNIPAVQTFGLDHVNVTNLFLFIIEDIVFLVTTLYPLWRSYDPMFHSVEDENTDQELKQLKKIIDMVPGYESFRAFLTREFSVQNLLFYCDVRDFHKKYNPNSLDPATNTHSPSSNTNNNIPIVVPSPSPVLPNTTLRSPSGTAPSSPLSTSRTTSLPPMPPSPNLMPQRTSLIRSSLIRTSIIGGVRSSSPRLPNESLIANFMGKKDKEKEKGIEMTAQQLAEQNKKLLLAEASIQFDAQRLFRKYVAFGAPLQVNLPDSAVAKLAHSLGFTRDGTRARRPRDRDTPGNSSFISTSTASRYNNSMTAPVPLPNGHSHVSVDMDPLTGTNYLMFDEAQNIILRLMAVDSFKRYKKSSDYQELTRLIDSDPILSIGLARI